MTVYLKDYSKDEFYDDGVTVNRNYQLKINYNALNYFSLVNTFSFDIPIYVLLFTIVSVVMITMVLILWVIVLGCY